MPFSTADALTANSNWSVTAAYQAITNVVYQANFMMAQ